LIALGQAQAYLALSASAREHCPPVPRLKVNWVHEANDDSTAFRIAAALAGLHGRDQDNSPRLYLPMIMHFAPVDDKQAEAWASVSSHAVIWNEGGLADNLYEVTKRRLLDTDRIPLPDKPFAHSATVPLTCVAEWLQSPQLDAQIDALLRGLVLARIPRLSSPANHQTTQLPAAYALLKPLFSTNAQLHNAGLLETNQSLALPRTLLTRLWQGRFDGGQGVLRAAQRRLQIAGLPLSANGLAIPNMNPHHLLMALLVPLDTHDLLQLIKPLRAPARNFASAVNA
jgi:CRISPR-associated protein Csx17